MSKKQPGSTGSNSSTNKSAASSPYSAPKKSNSSAGKKVFYRETLRDKAVRIENSQEGQAASIQELRDLTIGLLDTLNSQGNELKALRSELGSQKQEIKVLTDKLAAEGEKSKKFKEWFGVVRRNQSLMHHKIKNNEQSLDYLLSGGVPRDVQQNAVPEFSGASSNVVDSDSWVYDLLKSEKGPFSLSGFSGVNSSEASASSVSGDVFDPTRGPSPMNNPQGNYIASGPRPSSSATTVTGSAPNPLSSRGVGSVDGGLKR